MKTLNILLILFFLTACGKDEETITTIEGQLMASCDIPAANTSGFILTNDGLLSGPGISLSFTTDENGHFKVSHRGKADQLNSFTVRVQGSSDVLKVPGLAGDNKDLGKIYLSPPFANVLLNLVVQNNYSSQDTLFFRNIGFPNNEHGHWIKMAGPFTPGIIDSFPMCANLNALPIRFGSSTIPSIRLDYYINQYDSWNEKYVRIETPHCVDEYQTVTLVID